MKLIRGISKPAPDSTCQTRDGYNITDAEAERHDLCCCVCRVKNKDDSGVRGSKERGLSLVLIVDAS